MSEKSKPMERRFNRNSFASQHNVLRKKVAESRRSTAVEQTEAAAPDLSDFMNDMFFGTVKNEKKVYNLTGGDREQQQRLVDHDQESCSFDDDFESSTRSTNSRLTQEWLQEAKRMVASSPSRACGGDSPARLGGGSPRFAAAQAQLHHQQARLSVSSYDGRDPSNRSARRHRAVDGFGGEILSKSAKNVNHSRNNSSDSTTTTFTPPPPPPRPADNSPASVVHKWFSTILKHPSDPAPPPVPDPSPPLPPRLSTHRRSRFENQPTSPPPSIPDPNSQFVPPRQSFHRKSRFQADPAVTQPQGIPTQKRTFAAPQAPTNLLSPPKRLTESAHRRSLSSSTCILQDKQILSPPRNLVESASRRSISSTTCLIDRNLQSPINENVQLKDINVFLKEQRKKIGKLLRGEINGTAKIVLSGPSNSTSSMLSAICYSWLQETRVRNKKEEVQRDVTPVVVVPVMNVRRGKMWKQPQAAWLFHHVGIDAKALLFSEEVDLEALMMAKKLTILVVGQDILQSNGEVGSQCTILTDNYCEDAYDLLDTPILKKLLLAGILLDTQNLNPSTKLSMTRDAEAVQLLSVGCAPNYGNALYDQLMQDQRDGKFFEALRHNYGKPPSESNNSRAPVDHRSTERNSYPETNVQHLDKNSSQEKLERTSNTSSNSAKKAPVQAAEPSRGKNTFFLAKWFGFGK